MKNRRNHSSHEEEYFFRIALKTISDVNEFCNVIEHYHSNTQAEMVGIRTENVNAVSDDTDESEQMEFGDTDD